MADIGTNTTAPVELPAAPPLTLGRGWSVRVIGGLVAGLVTVALIGGATALAAAVTPESLDALGSFGPMVASLLTVAITTFVAWLRTDPLKVWVEQLLASGPSLSPAVPVVGGTPSALPPTTPDKTITVSVPLDEDPAVDVTAPAVDVPGVPDGTGTHRADPA